MIDLQHKNCAFWHGFPLFSREDHLCNLFLPTLVNYQTEMYCLTFKIFFYSDIFQSIYIC